MKVSNVPALVSIVSLEVTFIGIMILLLKAMVLQRPNISVLLQYL